MGRTPVRIRRRPPLSPLIELPAHPAPSSRRPALSRVARARGAVDSRHEGVIATRSKRYKRLAFAVLVEALAAGVAIAAGVST